ncbi:outer membrane protein assembly factor BamD [Lentilitoribacter sp. Alg239-R112]|uniref:outer membrane protein assembly factor BamD n=1 Tax=Lentilitoribacter sp. Alg239-R112 TaxID=2305987 RepID=UPI001FCEDBF3|nr:outer membrane protein assembly factor BamD [Lentilitoribacter sp. Alg239-R112]
MSLLMMALAGCQSDPDIDINSLVDSVEPADLLYNQALANLDAGKLREASNKFDKIDQQHPFSEFARKALVLNAFTKYRSGRNQEAITDAKRFLNLYPNDQDAAYAQYIIGLAYFRQIPDVTRDQRASSRAISAMQEVIDRYPDSEYVDDAQAKLRKARDQLAGKEMQIGRYYQERREYVAAVNRYKVVVQEYGNTRQVEEALSRLVESYFALGLTGEAQTAAAVLGHNYPDSEWYADSYKLLQSGGLEPRENRGSWISRAARRAAGFKT